MTNRRVVEVNDDLPWQIPGINDTASDDDSDAIVHDLIYTGSRHLVSSQPKVGKSVLALALSAAVRQHKRFLGLATEPTRILYLTEEQRRTFKPKLDRFGLEADDGFKYLRRSQPEVQGLTWEEIIPRVHKGAVAFGAGLVIVDVLSRWAGFQGEDENSAGAVLDALNQLEPLMEDGIATLILHHSPWAARRSRGSSAISGAVDMQFYLDGEPGAEQPRTLEWLGGRHEAQPRLSYRLGPEDLESLGSERLGPASKTSEVISALEELDRPATTAEIAEQLDWAERTARRWLDRAYRHRLIARDTGERAEFIWRKRRRREYLAELEEVES